MPIYKYGDRVKVRSGSGPHIGTVISVRGNVFNGYTCIVKFDNQQLIPPQMEFPESWLEDYDDKINCWGHWVNPKKVCPICRNEWHVMEHPIFGKKEIWKDCLKCKKTMEEIMKEIDK